MRSKVFLTSTLLGLIVAGAAYYAYVAFFRSAPTTPVTNGEPLGKYEVPSSLSENPALAVSQQKLDAGDVEGAVAELRAAKEAYAPGSPERSSLDMSVGLYYAFSATPEKGVAELATIALDEGTYNAATRAFAMEAIARTYFSTHEDVVFRSTFETGDAFFVDILKEAKGNYRGAMYLLLEKGHELSSTPIGAVRLMEKQAADIKATPTLTPDEVNKKIDAFNTFRKEALEEVGKMPSEGHYATYLSEFYASYAGALQLAIFAKLRVATREEVEDGYKKAYPLSSEVGKPFVVYRYASFLSVVAPTEVAKIEELTSRINGQSASQRALFDRFILNTLKEKEAGAGYSLFVKYRAVSPSFDAYVARVEAAAT